MTTGLLGGALASRAEHHGKALAFLELGETDKAIREAKTALNAAPVSPRLQQTVIGAYEEKRPLRQRSPAQSHLSVRRYDRC